MFELVQVRASASSPSNYYQYSADNKAKALAFAELVAYIESMIEGNQIFKLSDLHAIYQKRLG